MYDIKYICVSLALIKDKKGGIYSSIRVCNEENENCLTMFDTEEIIVPFTKDDEIVARIKRDDPHSNIELTLPSGVRDTLGIDGITVQHISIQHSSLKKDSLLGFGTETHTCGCDDKGDGYTFMVRFDHCKNPYKKVACWLNGAPQKNILQ